MTSTPRNPSRNRRDFLKESACGLGGCVVLGSSVAPGYADSALEDGTIFYNHETIASGCVDGPTIASDPTGNVWMAYLLRLAQGGQQIVVQHFQGHESPRTVFQSPTGSYETPVIGCGDEGNPLVVWSREQGNAWTLESLSLHDKTAERAVGADDGRGRAANPRLAVGRRGEYWLAWEEYHQGRFQVCLKSFRDGRWGPTIPVTDATVNAYDPAVVVDEDQVVWVAYGEADGGDRTIRIRAFDTKDEQWRQPIDVAVGGIAESMPNLNAHPDVACDADGRLWICWEARGKENRACWFGNRVCHVACYADGQVQTVANTADPLFRGSNDHLPTFAKDATGRLWLFTRRGDTRDTWVEKIRLRKWKIRASLLGPDGWCEPMTLLEDLPALIGRRHRPAVARCGDDAFWMLWQSDNFPHVLPEHYEYRLHRAQLHLPPPGEEEPSMSLRPATVVRRRSVRAARPRVERRRIERGGQAYTLLYGNLHEHTDFSRCTTTGNDGTPDENYRYGIDVQGYDFVGLTDHGYNLDRERWEQNLRAVRFYNDPPHFVAVPALEWTCSEEDRRRFPLPGSGHRNIIFASVEEAAAFVDEASHAVYHCKHPQSDRIDKVWEILRSKGLRAVTIPHHPADPNHPVHWGVENRDVETVVEVYQLRGSYEHRDCPLSNPAKTMRHDGCFVQDALARGRRLGFIASGDHNSMGIGVAALWVKEVSQEGIFEALRSRRCYGTSGDKIFLDFRINGHLTGEEFTTDETPVITARIEAPEPIENVVVFKNNKVFLEHTARDFGETGRHEFRAADDRFVADSFYYLRVVLRNQQVGWSSPIWVAPSGEKKSSVISRRTPQIRPR